LYEVRLAEIALAFVLETAPDPPPQLHDAAVGGLAREDVRPGANLRSRATHDAALRQLDSPRSVELRSRSDAFDDAGGCVHVAHRREGRD